MSDVPVWALVVHKPAKWLIDQVGDADDIPLDEWEIVEGADGHSALVSYDPGSEGVDADIARRLSAVDGAMYDVRLEDDLASVRLFEGGAYVRDVEVEPFEFLLDHGLDVRPPGRVRARSVIVVEDSDPAETSAALELSPGDALHVQAVPAGTVVYSDTGDVSSLLRLVAGNLPSRTVYLLAHLPGYHFLAHAVRGDEDLGVLYDPPGDDPELPALESVRGERDPIRIVRAFGVPAALLELPDE